MIFYHGIEMCRTKLKQCFERIFIISKIRTVRLEIGESGKNVLPGDRIHICIHMVSDIPKHLANKYFSPQNWYCN